MGTRSFLGVKSSQGMMLTPHPLWVPWSWKGRAIPLLPLLAVRPVQSLSACTRVHFTFLLYHERYLTSYPTMITIWCLLHSSCTAAVFVFTKHWGFRFRILKYSGILHRVNWCRVTALKYCSVFCIRARQFKKTALLTWRTSNLVLILNVKVHENHNVGTVSAEFDDKYVTHWGS